MLMKQLLLVGLLFASIINADQKLQVLGVRQPEAANLLERASRLASQLLPSEQRLLQISLSLLPQGVSPTGNKTQTTKNKTS